VRGDDRWRTRLRRVPAPVWLVAWTATVAAVSWDRFDIDEYANLQQALRLADGAGLYTETPSSHPPLYPLLLAAVAWTGEPLVAARLLSLALLCASGLVLADLLRRTAGPEARAWALGLWAVAAFVLVTGTRAMNEVPVLFLVTLAAWLLFTAPGRRHAALAGVALAAAFLFRYTAAFVAVPFLALGARRVMPTVVAGAAAVAAAVALFFAVWPDAAAAFLDQTLRLHAGRTPMDIWFRIGKVLAWGLLPWALVAVAAVPALRRAGDVVSRMVVLACASGFAMIGLPVVHYHYFLPFAPLAVAAVAMLLVRLRSDGRTRAARAVVVVWLVAGAAQAAPYLVHDLRGLDGAHEQAATIASWVPSGEAILTDTPHLAVLADRENLGGYYWSLVQRPPFPATAVDNVTLAIDGGATPHANLPDAVLARIEGWPCRTVDGLAAWWNPARGDPPAGFEVGCIQAS
jgi:4-amino-4-deoxy-L-arabinose transferase-like glycosyltransferase